MVFLGIDCSTQSISVVAVNDKLQNIYELQFEFDKHLPQYNTKNGCIQIEDTVVSPSMMWVEGLFKLLDQMKKDNFQFDQVKGISASGQQHGTVYWKSDKFPTNLYSKPLPSPEEIFSIPMSPIWRDSSTTNECNLLSKEKTPLWWRKTTGSLPYERFSGV